MPSCGVKPYENDPSSIFLFDYFNATSFQLCHKRWGNDDAGFDVLKHLGFFGLDRQQPFRGSLDFPSRDHHYAVFIPYNQVASMNGHAAARDRTVDLSRAILEGRRWTGAAYEHR